MDREDKNFELQQQAADQVLMELIQGQQLMIKVVGKCFEKCVDNIESDLSRRQEDCIANCAKNIMEVEAFTEKRFQMLLQSKMDHSQQ